MSNTIASDTIGSSVAGIYGVPMRYIDGRETTLEEYRGQLLLIVNVASKCGLTPQYTGLQELQARYHDRGFTVLGFPCNQFAGQEPGTAEEIMEFCSVNYGVTFPLFEKIEVNGQGCHPLYAQLTQVPDPGGKSGALLWNFEKFLVSADGKLVKRWLPLTEPTAPDIIETIEANLPKP